MGRSSHTPAANGSKWIRPSTRWAIYHRDDFRCVYCGRVGALSLDHVHSVEGNGRDNRAENLVTSCIGCNSKKQALTHRQWLAKLREMGLLTASVARRIARAIRRPIDREVGRLLAGRADAEDEAAEAVELTAAALEVTS